MRNFSLFNTQAPALCCYLHFLFLRLAKFLALMIAHPARSHNSRVSGEDLLVRRPRAPVCVDFVNVSAPLPSCWVLARTRTLTLVKALKPRILSANASTERHMPPLSLVGACRNVGVQCSAHGCRRAAAGKPKGQRQSTSIEAGLRRPDLVHGTSVC